MPSTAKAIAAAPQGVPAQPAHKRVIAKPAQNHIRPTGPGKVVIARPAHDIAVGHVKVSRDIPPGTPPDAAEIVKR